MASINLGSVYFTLGADTKLLQMARKDMKAMADEVDRLSRMKSDEAQASARQLLRQEQLSRANIRQAASLTHMMRSAGMAEEHINRLGVSVNNVNKVLGDAKAAPQDVARAMAHMNDMYNRSRQEMRLFQDQQKRFGQVGDLGRQVESLVGQTRALGIFTISGQGLVQEWDRFRLAVKEGTMNSAQFAQAQLSLKDRIAQVKDELRGANEQLRIRNQIMAAERQMIALRATAARKGTNISAVESQFTALQAMSRDPSISTAGVGALNFANQLNAFKKAAAEAQIAARGVGASSEHVAKFADAAKAVRAGAVVAIGPLSRFGAIVGSIGGILDSGQIKMAAFAAGFLITVFAAARLITALTETRLVVDRIIASLTIAAGTSSLAQVEFENLVAVSNKFGLSVRDVGENFGRFAAAATVSGLTMKEVRSIFEGTTAAATALRLRGDQTRLMFLALEQMLSKGKVATEELRRQFAEHVPGGMKIAADALGVTTQKLNDMLAKGEVIARDFLPKLGLQLKRVFGDQAERSAQSLQAAFGRLSTSTLVFLNEFDKATGVTTTLGSIINGLAQALTFLGKNMDTTIAGVQALGLGLVAAFSPQIIGGIIAASRAMAAFAASITAVNLASGAGIVGALLKIVAAVGAAIFAYDALTTAQKVNLDSMRDWVVQAGTLINASTKATRAIKAQAEALYYQSVGKVTDVAAEYFKLNQELNKSYANFQRTGQAAQNAGRPIDWQSQFERANRASIARLRELESSKKLLEGKQAEIKAFLDKPTVPDDKIETGKASKRQAEFEKVADMIAKVRQFREEIEQMNKVNAEFKDPEVLRTVGELLRKMSGPEAAQIAKILKENGYWIGNLKDSLINLGKQYQDTKLSHDDLIKAMTEGKKVVQDLVKEWAEWDAQIKAWQAGPSGAEKFKDLAARAKYLQEVIEKLSKTKPYLQQSEIDALVKRAGDEFDRKLKEQRKFEQVSEAARGAAQDIIGGFRDAGNAIAEAFLKGERAAFKFDEIVNNILLKVYNKILNFVLFNPLEKWLEQILYRVFGSIVPGAGLGGGVDASGTILGAKGLAIAGGNVVPMAKGGVLTSPTIIPLARGAAVARERGRDEAVVPIARMANGDMGIAAQGMGGANVFVNIYGAPAGANVNRRKSSRGEEIDITFDRQMSKTIKSRGEAYNSMLNTMAVRPTLQR